ncbi:MAG: class I SAM-dependent methyltransferase [Chloroflexi bacterium]|nr:class I SAM-dependent methyltransferase [Chloroflexota bacterium]
MTEQSAASRAYTMGYSEEFLQLLDRRNAQNSAAYLLPLLEPGMRVLDLGCGPGTISVGLAEAVNPGEVQGIDMEASQIDLAHAAAAAGGHSNISFHVGNALDLPFDSDYFDVVHAHAVIMHIPDTEAVLSQVRRVLKPGGLFASRDLIAESSFIEPASDGLREAWETFTNLMRGNGGHPEIGKELNGILLNAGFSDIRCSASFDSYGTPPDLDFYYGFIVDWFFSPNVIAAVTGLGIATQEKFDYWRGELDAWRANPRAFGALAFGECLAING